MRKANSPPPQWTSLPTDRSFNARLTWTPKAKDRPRTVVKRAPDGHSYHHIYTPRGTMEAEANLKRQWTFPPIDGAINVELVLSDTEVGITIVPCAPATSRKLRADLDNYAKLILDALNGVAWGDDRQIASLTVKAV